MTAKVDSVSAVTTILDLIAIAVKWDTIAFLIVNRVPVIYKDRRMKYVLKMEDVCVRMVSLGRHVTSVPPATLTIRTAMFAVALDPALWGPTVMPRDSADVKWVTVV